MSDSVIESIQEIVSKLNKAERALSHVSNVHLDDFEILSPTL